MSSTNSLTVWESLFQIFQNSGIKNSYKSHFHFETLFFCFREDCLYSVESSSTHYKLQNLKMVSSDDLVSPVMLSWWCTEDWLLFCDICVSVLLGWQRRGRPCWQGWARWTWSSWTKGQSDFTLEMFSSFAPMNMSLPDEKQNKVLVSELLNENAVKYSSPEDSGSFVFTAVELQFEWTLVWFTK